MKTKTVPSFSQTLYVIFLSSILIPTLVFAIGFSIYFNSVQVKRHKAETSERLRHVSHQISMKIQDLGDVARTCLLFPSAMASFRLFVHPDSQLDQSRINQIEGTYVNTMYQLLGGGTRDFEAVTFFPASPTDTCYVISLVSVGLKAMKGFSYADTDWYRKALEDNKPHVSFQNTLPSYLRYYDSFPIVSVAMRIHDTDGREPLGVVKVDMRSSRLEEILAAFSTSDSSTLVLASDADILLSSDQRYRDGEEGAIDLENYRVSREPIEGTDWSLCSIDHRQSGMLTMVPTFLVALCIVGLEFGIGLLVYRRRSRTIRDGMETILALLHRYRDGDLSATTEPVGNKELDEIIVAANDMANQLSLWIDREFTAVIDKQRAEYRALQSQINPHFLYNTLNGFIALGRMGKQQELEASIIALTKLFRYTCNGPDIVTVAEETAFVGQYLSLQQMKYGERLAYAIRVDKEAGERTIPRLILQPLVENAIVHGLEPIDRQVRITIEATVDGRTLTLTVEDDGAGCGNPASDNEHSLAFTNIERRLQLFAKGSTMHHRGNGGKGFSVVLTIPATRT